MDSHHKNSIVRVDWFVAIMKYISEIGYISCGINKYKLINYYLLSSNTLYIWVVTCTPEYLTFVLRAIYDNGD